MTTHDSSDFNSETIQERIRESQAKSCNHGFNSKPGWCPEAWDEILCWRATPPGELAIEQCPHYIAGFDTQANATRQCMSDGHWYWSAATNRTWTNYTQCYHNQLVTVLMDIDNGSTDNVTLLQKYLPVVKTISKVGYAFSFFTLVIAFCILAAIKKLRCPRNILHMHLFASFMARAFMALLKDILYVSGIGLASDIVVKNGESYLVDGLESNLDCKIFTSFWQYFILANYSWILIEGLYLHNLVFLALFTDSNSSITVYIVLGWGMPAIFVFLWVILKAVFEDTLCWTINNNQYLFLVIRVPTMLSILINFVLFVNIVRVLLSKLKSTVSEETQRYKRWARSTLVLVPLFGVHYTVFLGMSYSMGVNETVEIVWLFCDQLFASFQGFFVAVLYCFLNGEVRVEVARVIRSRNWSYLRRGRWGQRRSTHSGSTCSCNATKLKKSSGSTWWHKPLFRCLYRDRDSHHRSIHSMASTQDVGLGTRGGSLSSSRGYLEVVGNGPYPGAGNYVQNANHASPLCSKCTDQSLLSFCSNMSEMSACATVPGLERGERIRDQHRWSDSECCHLAYELHSLHHHPQP